MLQSNSLTMPFIIAITSTSLSFNQPADYNFQTHHYLEENVYRTTTQGEYFDNSNIRPNRNEIRNRALTLFGGQSNLTDEERSIKMESLRKVSKSAGLNIFDLYIKENNV